MAKKLINTTIKLGEGTLLKEAIFEHLEYKSNPGITQNGWAFNLNVYTWGHLVGVYAYVVPSATLSQRHKGTVIGNIPEKARPVYATRAFMNQSSDLGVETPIIIKTNGDIVLGKDCLNLAQEMHFVYMRSNSE